MYEIVQLTPFRTVLSTNNTYHWVCKLDNCNVHALIHTWDMRVTCEVTVGVGGGWGRSQHCWKSDTEDLNHRGPTLREKTQIFSASLSNVNMRWSCERTCPCTSAVHQSSSMWENGTSLFTYSMLCHCQNWVREGSNWLHRVPNSHFALVAIALHYITLHSLRDGSS